METLTIEISNPEVKRLIDDMAALGLISVKETKPSWNERWSNFSNTLPNITEISEEDIFKEISEIRTERSL
ncbi:hypothetical protein [Dyadobacter sp. Leaf189]|uniref:hypothetical protein n=1 Tax=Dyadobacter sp. Leaf189 TaxID=1736295 RepID=UPI0006F8EC03|nr:hypothetical protein [Dyadobacter sp. Leaf189]KQS27741.1 hypothetical protein ASG33_15025 [Dyadobacter sp. Leaf189]